MAVPSNLGSVAAGSTGLGGPLRVHSWEKAVLRLQGGEDLWFYGDILAFRFAALPAPHSAPASFLFDASRVSQRLRPVPGCVYFSGGFGCRGFLQRSPASTGPTQDRAGRLTSAVTPFPTSGQVGFTAHRAATRLSSRNATQAQAHDEAPSRRPAPHHTGGHLICASGSSAVRVHFPSSRSGVSTSTQLRFLHSDRIMQRGYSHARCSRHTYRAS